MSTYFLIAAVLLTGVAVAALSRPFVNSSNKKVAIALGVLVPAFAVGMYLLIGSTKPNNQRVPTSTSVTSTSSTQSPATEKVGSVASMTDSLESRLNAEGGSGKDWLLLAKSYHHLGRIEDSQRAYDMAKQFGVADEDLSASIQSGEKNSSIDTAAAVIAGDLSLSDRAANIARADDTVFIFARAPGNGGVPAAVLQKSVSDLPLQFELRDSNAMVAGVNLSSLDEVVVTARISRSGNATEALQDLQATSPTIVVANAEHVILEIE